MSDSTSASEPQRTSIPRKILIIALSSAVVSLATGWVLKQSGIYIQVPDSVEMFSLIEILGSLLFSLLAALIYWELYDVQSQQSGIIKEQKDIQDQQREIQSRQNRPYVVVEDSHRIPQDERLQVNLSNFGPAPATNISFLALTADTDSPAVLGVKRANRDEEGYDGWVGLGDFLKPGEEYVSFSSGEPDLNWSAVTEESEVSVFAGFKYNDISDKDYVQFLLHAEVDPTVKPDFSDISWSFVDSSHPAMKSRLSDRIDI